MTEQLKRAARRRKPRSAEEGASVDLPWRRPAKRRDLRRMARDVLGLVVPDTPVCEGHDTPMDYLWHACHPRGDSALVWACRGGSKTMLAAAATVIESVFTPGLATCILGGSLAQSSYMYDYVRAFLQRPEMAPLAAKVTSSRAALANGSTVEILAQSDRAIRGVHVPRLRLDEVEEFRDDLFQAALFLPTSSGGAGARIEMLSTMHRAYGLMSELVDDHERRGLRLFRWCLWEIIERCSNRDCSACPLFADCGGKAKRANGYYPIDDAIARRKIVSDEAWQSEMLCKRPSRDGLFYKAFDESVHVPREAIGFDPGLETYRSFDWGVNGPTVCLWIQVDGDGRARVIDELFQSGLAVSDMARGVAAYEEMRGYRNVLRSYCDPSGPSYMLEFGKEGIPCQGRREDGGRVNVRFEGFETVRRFLKLDAFGKPKLLVSPRCVNVRREFRTYRYPETRLGMNPSEEPAKVDDHAMDALRYFFTSRFPQNDWRIV